MHESLPILPTILFVDNEPTAIKSFMDACGDIGTLITAESVERAMHLLSLYGDSLCILISNQCMQTEHGNALLIHSKEKYPQIVRILTTTHTDLEYYVAAVNQAEIFRYLPIPWNVAELREEVQQALNVAELGKERDSLIREKLLVMGKQILMNRIAAIDSLCKMLSSSGIVATDSYLGMAKANQKPLGEPDWMIHDLVEVIAGESQRFAQFGRRVSAAVSLLNTSGIEPSAVLRNQLGDLVFESTNSSHGTSQIAVRKSRKFAEFLDLPLTSDISNEHVNWLAALIWLGNQNTRAYYMSEGTTDLLCTDNIADIDTVSLATWLDRCTD